MSATRTRSARIRSAVEGISVLQILVLIGMTLLVLFGVLLGGRNYVSAVDTNKLVSQPANVINAQQHSRGGRCGLPPGLRSWTRKSRKATRKVRTSGTCTACRGSRWDSRAVPFGRPAVSDSAHECNEALTDSAVSPLPPRLRLTASVAGTRPCRRRDMCGECRGRSSLGTRRCGPGRVVRQPRRRWDDAVHRSGGGRHFRRRRGGRASSRDSGSPLGLRTGGGAPGPAHHDPSARRVLRLRRR